MMAAAAYEADFNAPACHPAADSPKCGAFGKAGMPESQAAQAPSTDLDISLGARQGPLDAEPVSSRELHRPGKVILGKAQLWPPD